MDDWGGEAAEGVNLNLFIFSLSSLVLFPCYFVKNNGLCNYTQLINDVNRAISVITYSDRHTETNLGICT